MDEGKQAHRIYLRMQRLYFELALDHPARPYLGAAIESARLHWTSLVEAKEDRLLAQVPARVARDLAGGCG